MSAVVFVVDAGPVAGLGHLQRCLALAEALAQAGVQSLFVGCGDDHRLAPRVTAAGHAYTVLGAEPWTAAAADAVAAEASRRGSTLVVLDRDGEATEFERRLRERGPAVCLIDDNGRRDVSADYVVNGNVHATTLVYPGIMPDRCLLGPRYVMLPSRYWTSTAPDIRVPPLRLLVTLGGGDPHDLWPRLLGALADVPPEVTTTVVIGPFVAPTVSLAAAIERFGTRAVIRHAPPSLGDLVADADIVISAAGQTLYELAALGRPAVAIQLADNQGPQLRAFVAEGTVVSAGHVSEPGIERIAVSRVVDLAGQPARLQHMAAAGRRVVDGQGSRRVAAAVMAWASGSLISTKGLAT